MWTWACVCALSVLTACGDDEKPAENPDTAQGDKCEAGQSVCEITQNITSDTTWTKDHTYVLEANVFVKDATLKIEAGTVIKGNYNTSLAITSSAKIDAQGTAAAPIVFTSVIDPGSRQAGNWVELSCWARRPSTCRAAWTTSRATRRARPTSTAARTRRTTAAPSSPPASSSLASAWAATTS